METRIGEHPLPSPKSPTPPGLVRIPAVRSTIPTTEVQTRPFQAAASQDEHREPAVAHSAV